MKLTPIVVMCLFVTTSGAWYDFAVAQDDGAEESGNQGKYPSAIRYLPHQQLR